MPNLHFESSLSDLLVAFEAGNPPAREILPRRTQSGLNAMARQIGGDLTDDQQQDLVQRTLGNVLEGEAEYDPDRSSPWTYLRLHMKNAARQVRAAYAAPGAPKWASKSSDHGGSKTRYVSLDDAPVAAQATTPNCERVLDAKIALENANRVFEDKTPYALKELSRGASRDEAAAVAGYSRRTFGRRLEALRDRLSR